MHLTKTLVPHSEELSNSRNVGTSSQPLLIKCRTCLESTNCYTEVSKLCYSDIPFKVLLIHLVPAMAKTLSDEDCLCEECSQTLVTCAKFIDKCWKVEAALLEKEKLLQQKPIGDEFGDPSHQAGVEEILIIKEEPEESRTVEQLTCPNEEKRNGSPQPIHVSEESDPNAFLDFPSIPNTIATSSIAISMTQPNGVILDITRNLVSNGIHVTQFFENNGTDSRKRVLLLGSHIPDPKYKCPRCSKYKETRKKWLLHVKACGRNLWRRQEGFRTKCLVCSRFVRLRDMELHLKAHKDGTSLEDTVCGWKGNISFKCRTCSESFSTRERYLDHLMIHPPFVCDKCGKAFTENAKFLRHKNYHEKRDRKSLIKAVCEICGRAFRNFPNLHTHLEIHSGVTLKCSLCPKVFKGNRYLKRHLKRVHSVREKVKCSECNKVFSSSLNLAAHKKLKHMEVKRHTCTVCDQGFSRGDYFRRHMLVHQVQGPKPSGSTLRKKYVVETESGTFKCKFCGKEFNSPHRLRMHLLDRHRKLNRYKCTLCNLTFSNNSNRFRHQKTFHGTPNGNYRCIVCWKWMKSKEELDAHVLNHNRPRRYKCKECGEKFIRKYNLTSHVLEKHVDEDAVRQEFNSVIEAMDEYKY